MKVRFLKRFGLATLAAGVGAVGQAIATFDLLELGIYVAVVGLGAALGAGGLGKLADKLIARIREWLSKV